jgi:5-methylcytosine-specific restriction enzyme B
MTEKLTADKLREQFQLFLEWAKEEGRTTWREEYVAHLDRVKKTSGSAWLQPAFQQSLWEPKTIAAIGPGNSVTVVGAYNDNEISEFLLVLRDTGLSGSIADRCTEVQAAYDKILAFVYPKYTERRPRARIVRLLAGIYPDDMTCLMDARRTNQIEALLGVSKAQTDFVGQNPLIRAHLSDIWESLSTREETSNIRRSIGICGRRTSGLQSLEQLKRSVREANRWTFPNCLCYPQAHSAAASLAYKTTSACLLQLPESLNRELAGTT